MWVSASAFRRGLYAEHHDELAFLYAQIARLRDDDDTPLSSVLDFERRLVAHLDALVIGAATAWGEIEARHDDESAGHWYAAALLACAQRDEPRFAALLQRASRGGSEDAARALSDALRHAMPPDWAQRLPAWLVDASEPLLGWLADAASYRQPQACRDALGRHFARAPAPSIAFVRALGRAGVAAASAWLGELSLRHADADLRCAALLALADMRDEKALVLARRLVDLPQVAHRVLGLIGDRGDAHALVDRLGSATPETLFALGLLGELSATRPLLELLPHESLGGAAATALHWITGAPLLESVIEPDEDEASGDYLRLRPGAALRRRPDGRPFGTEVQRLGRDPARWAQWLAQAAPRFQAGLCYRLGQPRTPAWLIAALADESRGARYRHLASEELPMRHRAPHRLDPRATVGRQRAVLQRLAAWAGNECEDATK